MTWRKRNPLCGLWLLVLLAGSSTAGASPNVLFIIADDLNTRIGPYSNLDYHTPNLDALAEQSLRFDRAYCQYPICGPSRASLMSGMYPETNGVVRNDYRLGSYRVVNPDLADHPSLGQLFRNNGYYTARVSKIYHMGVPGGIERGEAGADDPLSWDFAANIMGPETLSAGLLELLSPMNLHYGSNFSRMVLDDRFAETQTDYLATSQAIAILENRLHPVAEGARNQVKEKPDEPFFLAVGLVRPHVPLIAPERSFRAVDEASVQLPQYPTGSRVPEEALRRKNDAIWGMDEAQQRGTIEAYLASIHFMDEQVGRLLEALDRLQAREDTIVVFVSDHGYNLGEHDCWSKISLWEESLRVPLLISAPGFSSTAGSSTDAVVELIDLYPTLAELCGLGESVPDRVQGTSLVPLFRDVAAPQDDEWAYAITSTGKDGSIIGERWKYTRWGPHAVADKEELYDLHKHPLESRNLVWDPAFAEKLAEMRERFDRQRRDLTVP